MKRLTILSAIATLPLLACSWAPTVRVLDASEMVMVSGGACNVNSTPNCPPGNGFVCGNDCPVRKGIVTCANNFFTEKYSNGTYSKAVPSSGTAGSQGTAPAGNKNCSVARDCQSTCSTVGTTVTCDIGQNYNANPTAQTVESGDACATPTTSTTVSTSPTAP